QFVLCIREFGFVLHFYSHVRIRLRRKILVKRAERHCHHRVPTEQAEKRSLSRVYADDLEKLTVDQNRFVDWALRRKQCVGDIVTDDNYIVATARFHIAKEAAFFAIDCRCYDEVRSRPEHENVI